MNTMLFNSSSDIIIKLAADWKILEFNPEAEKYLGKRREEILNNNFIQMFIPESLQEKTENEMNKVLNDSQNTRYKMQLLTDSDKITVTDWYVTILTDNLKAPVGMILSIKK
jgi:two-component system CheB/CheR fusion protein